MMTLITAVFLCAMVGMSIQREECAMFPLGYYEEIGCEPVFSESDCPIRYECPQLKRNSTKRVCYHKNRTYAIGEIVASTEIGPCQKGCVCTDTSDTSALPNWSCPHIDCASSSTPMKNHCIQQHTLDGCCPSILCDSVEISKLTTCIYDSNIYKEGQSFYPDKTCKMCICNKAFDGTPESNGCREIRCGTETFFSSETRDLKCSPIYQEESLCCPIGFKCSEPTDSFIQSSLPKNTDLNMKCTFGNLKLNVGDKVKGIDKCVTCTCDVPPLLTCIREKACFSS